MWTCAWYSPPRISRGEGAYRIIYRLVFQWASICLFTHRTNSTAYALNLPAGTGRSHPAEIYKSTDPKGLALPAAVDSLIVEAGDSEGVYLASFNLERLRDFRKHEIWGNAFRKPHAYSLLVAEEVREPFVRPQAR